MCASPPFFVVSFLFLFFIHVSHFSLSFIYVMYNVRGSCVWGVVGGVGRLCAFDRNTHHATSHTHTHSLTIFVYIYHTDDGLFVHAQIYRHTHHALVHAHTHTHHHHTFKLGDCACAHNQTHAHTQTLYCVAVLLSVLGFGSGYSVARLLDHRWVAPPG